MIIFKDILTDDEIISDVYKLIDAPDAGGCLWEIDAQMVKPNQDSFVLEGANASAEGEDADEGDEAGDNTPVLNLARDFRLQSIGAPPEAKAFAADMKKYLKDVMKKMTETGVPKEEIDEFKKGAPAALKKLTKNLKNYDAYIGESGEPGNCMYVLVDFREDGTTPYATIWKHGLTQMKV